MSGPHAAEQAAHDTLLYDTLSRGDEDFIHQVVVDAWTLQHAHPDSKPIAITFALLGLYLHLEHGYSGRAVQRVHMHLARERRSWPAWDPPVARGEVRVTDVVAADDRDAAIHAWASAVWLAWSTHRAAIHALLVREGVLTGES